MQIRLINKEEDIDKINSFLPFKTTSEELPGHTFCAERNGKIVAIAGLRLAEGPVCLLDSMATNKACDSFERVSAINILAKTILEKAKELGFKTIIATTKEKSIELIAVELGFSKIDQIIIAKEL